MIRLPANQFKKLRKEMASVDYQNLGELSDECSILLSTSSDPKSFDTPVGDDSKMTLLEILGDESEDTMELTINNSMMDKVRKAIEPLTKREQVVIESLFGLNGEAKNLEETGQMLGVSYERVRQIREKALKRLRVSNETLKQELMVV